MKNITKESWEVARFNEKVAKLATLQVAAGFIPIYLYTTQYLINNSIAIDFLGCDRKKAHFLNWIFRCSSLAFTNLLSPTACIVPGPICIFANSPSPIEEKLVVNKKIKRLLL